VVKTDQDGWAIPREQAIPRLLDLHGGRLYGLGRRICRTPEEAEDLVQEIFLQAWRKWDQFDGRSDPIVWLYTIAQRACQRMHRKRSGEPSRLDSLDDLMPFGAARIATLPAEADVLDEQFRREQLEAIGTALAELDDEFRMPLVLKDIIGFSIDEVAAILGVKPATVKTRVHRARLKLRGALAHGLPHVAMPPASYSKQVCLDLLHAKQESLDRGVEMPNADAIICDRCEAVFSTLEYAVELCRTFGETQLPERLRTALLRAMREADPAHDGDTGNGSDR
jgi:RNA polymerase sigma-70 factor (ECF subfamily)